MKKIVYIIGITVATMFASCQKDADVDTSHKGDREVVFRAEPISQYTRVVGSEWETGDAIGIIMVGESGIHYNNVKYVAAADAAEALFTPATDAETIYFPSNGEQVEFQAYYPYQEGWDMFGEMFFDISGQDGTAEGLDNADLMYSNAIHAQTSGEQVFQFCHDFSKVQITVSNYDELSAFENLDNLTATISSHYTTYDNSNSKRIESEDAKSFEMVKTTVDENRVVFTAIILPSGGEDTTDEEITFSDGTSVYASTLAINAYSGTQYNFTTTVGDQGITYVELKGDGVTDWEGQEDSALEKDIEIVDGTYQIYTVTGMKVFANAANSGNTSINGKLMQNIDLGGSEENQWVPIGRAKNEYSGTFDGGGYEISGLYINNESNYQGLFGYIRGASIKNLGVSGSVTGSQRVGGIVGATWGSLITNCYNKAAVNGNLNVGGIAGFVTYSGTSITNCYNIGTLKGHSTNPSHIGGIVGSVDYNTNNITSCYNASTITAGNILGGIAGQIGSNTKVESCYYDTNLFSGVGVNFGTGEANGFSMDNMKSKRLLCHLNNAAYAYNQTNPTAKASAWKVAENGYPELDTKSEATYRSADIAYDATNDIYEISTGDGLRTYADLVNGKAQSVSDLFIDNSLEDVAKYFVFDTYHLTIDGKLMCNVDLGGESNEFTAMGTYANKFSGKFDGGGHKVSGLYINQPSTNYQGLFGYISESDIRNLGVSGSVTGKEDVGGVVGYLNNSDLNSCYSNVEVEGENLVGGVVGYAYEVSNLSPRSITCCFSTASVKGSGSYVGGVVGGTLSYVKMKYCYSNSSVFAGDAIGSNNKRINIIEVAGYPASLMTSSLFTTIINNGAYDYNQTSPTTPACAWQSVAGDYPELDVDGTLSKEEITGCTRFGSGTESDPYVIISKEQLNDLASSVNSGEPYKGKYFKLIGDVYLESSGYNRFTPIGTEDNPFQGIFDGCGNKIAELYVNDDESSYMGLLVASAVLRSRT